MKSTATNSFNYQVGNNNAKNLPPKPYTSTVDEENASDTIIYHHHNNLMGSPSGGIHIPSFPPLKLDQQSK